ARPRSPSPAQPTSRSAARVAAASLTGRESLPLHRPHELRVRDTLARSAFECLHELRIRETLVRFAFECFHERRRAMATDETVRPDDQLRRRFRPILRQCKTEKLQLVRFLYCGNDGVIRGKAAHARFLESYLHSGIGLTVAMQSFNMLDQLAADGSFGPVGEIRLVPDPATFRVLPYAPRSARLLCDMLTLDGAPWAPGPRPFLKRMIDRAAAHGL